MAGAHPLRAVGRPRPAPAVVQLVHGIAEYVARYDSFARFLNRQGFLVVGEDHMGHGGPWLLEIPRLLPWRVERRRGRHICAPSKDPRGMSPTSLCDPGPPMGSFLTRTLLYRHPDSGIRAAVICGTAWQPDAALKTGLAMCRHVCQKHGETQVYEPLRNLIFGSYNRRIPEAKTPFDWVCGDAQILNAYLADPLCGFSKLPDWIGTCSLASG